jgi:hypothetical protein
MTMVSTGPISLGGTGTSGGLNQSVNVELGRSGTATINMNETAVRTLAGVASGAISMNNFYGKSNAFSLTATISSNTQNYNLLTAMQAAGYVNGSAYTVNLTINSGVYVWSDSTSLAGFDTGAITGTGTINLTNNGFIMGKGGTGGGWVTSRVAATAGGPAINIQRPVSITNNSFIGGGGGGGGFAGQFNVNLTTGGGGGAGGGNAGGGWVNNTVYAGTTGGAPGTAGTPATSTVSTSQTSLAGASGGRIMPGVTVTALPISTGGSVIGANGSSRTGAGAGGGGFAGGPPGGKGITLSRGGFAGNAGDTASGASSSGIAIGGGGGGGYGAAGGTGAGTAGQVYGAGAAGGNAVNLNGNAVTWVATGTRYGAIS